MATPQTEAERILEARRDIERTAHAMFEVEREIKEEQYKEAGRPTTLLQTWETTSDARRAFFREWAKRALERDIVRVGARPSTGPVPLRGQLELEK